MTMPLPDSLLAYDHVEVSYGGTPVVHDVSFSVAEGEVICVVGESGSGKSTLVKAAMGLLGAGGLVTRGDIWYGGRSLPDLAPREMRALCGTELAVVFQDCLAAFAPVRRIGDQLHEAMASHQAISRAECDRLATRHFEALGLRDPERVLASYPFELSGGMGQRVGIAAALMGKPRVLFADEPTSALDIVAQTQVMDLIRTINEQMGTTVVLVTHNMGVVRHLADHVVVLKDGCVVECGSARQVMDAPTSDYTRELIAATPQIHCDSEREEGLHGC